jgi:hypothetical protein
VCTSIVACELADGALGAPFDGGSGGVQGMRGVGEVAYALEVEHGQRLVFKGGDHAIGAGMLEKLDGLGMPIRLGDHLVENGGVGIEWNGSVRAAGGRVEASNGVGCYRPRTVRMSGSAAVRSSVKNTVRVSSVASSPPPAWVAIARSRSRITTTAMSSAWRSPA